MLQWVKGLLDSNTVLWHKLDKLRIAAQAIVDMVDVAEEDVEAPLALVEKVRKVPQGIMRYILATTRQYVPNVLGLVKSNWPQSVLAPLGEGMNPDCEENQFEE